MISLSSVIALIRYRYEPYMALRIIHSWVQWGQINFDVVVVVVAHSERISTDYEVQAELETQIKISMLSCVL